jgi:mono/diheme cytochrome c family protein
MGNVITRVLRILGFVVAGILILCVGVTGYEYAAARPAVEEQRAAHEGRQLFATYCLPCHGPAMQGHVPNAIQDAPPLKKPGFAIFFYTMPKDMEGFVAGLIGTGRRGMPSFQAILNPDQRASLAAFIRGANTGSEPLP